MYTIRGSLQSVTNLPPSGIKGDAWIIQGDLFMWDGTCWSSRGPVGGPAPAMGANGNMSAYYPYGSAEALTERKEIIESKLIWKGISVTLFSEDDIKSLFFSQYALTKEDMAMFQMTYPEHFQEFRRQWAEKWAIETAKNEFDSWSDDYYEKKQRRNYP